MIRKVFIVRLIILSKLVTLTRHSWDPHQFNNVTVMNISYCHILFTLFADKVFIKGSIICYHSSLHALYSM